MFAEVVMTTAMEKIWMLCAGMLIVNFAASAGDDLKTPETGAAGKSGRQEPAGQVRSGNAEG